MRGSEQDLASNFEGLLAFLTSKNNPQSSLVAQTVKNPPADAGEAGDVGSIPGLGRYSGEGNGTPLQYSCLENSTDRGTWQGTVHGIAKSRTQLSD